MKVLLVSSRYPVPPWRGNQVRTMEWLSALSSAEIRLVCPRSGSTEPTSVPAHVVTHPSAPMDRVAGLLGAAFHGRPFQEGLYDSRRGREVVAAEVRRFRPDVVVVQMVRCGWAADAVLQAAPRVPILFDAIDAMGLHFDRAAASSAFVKAWALRREGARCQRREKRLSQSSRLTVAVSARDLEALSVPDERGRVIPVAGRETVRRETPASGKVVLLSGNLGYRPTVDGAEWFAREVWPGVLARAPESRWILAGARPAPTIRRLARLPGVEVHADVPDLGRYLGMARVAVAPMSSGSGVPMKVLEAMASAVPAVVHPWAARGLAPDAASTVVVADDAADWIDAIVGLFGDRDAARDLGAAARTAWERFYHPDVVAQQIRDAVTETAESQRSDV